MLTRCMSGHCHTRALCILDKHRFPERSPLRAICAVQLVGPMPFSIAGCPLVKFHRENRVPHADTTLGQNEHGHIPVGISVHVGCMIWCVLFLGKLSNSEASTQLQWQSPLQLQFVQTAAHRLVQRCTPGRTRTLVGGGLAM